MWCQKGMVDMATKEPIKRPRIIAIQGEDCYLIEVDEKNSRVCEVKGGLPILIFPPFLTISILARGYWEEYTGPPELVDKLLAEAVEYDEWAAANRD